MRGPALICCAGLLCWASAAGATPFYPDGAQALETRLLTKIGPQTRAWIAGEARREVTSGFYSQDTRDQACMRLGVSAADIPIVSFLLLMEDARDADADVSAAVNSRNPAATQVSREEQLARGINNYSIRSELSPGSEMAAQSQGSTFLTSSLKTQDPATAGTTHPEDVAPPPPPPKPADMQRVMDREADIEDALGPAMQRITPSVEAAMQPMA